MSYEALIRFAPETSAARLNDERREKRTLYDTSQLRMLPNTKTIPLVQDHDPGKELGTVTDLMRLQDVDGWWLCAVASLETCPSWLKRGTRSSFQYRELAHDTFGHNIVRSGLVSEVSVLSPGVEPYEPLAQVLYVKPKVEKPAPVRRAVAAGEYKLKPGEVIINTPQTIRRTTAQGITPRQETEELRRRVEFYGPDMPMELLLENMHRELAAVR